MIMPPVFRFAPSPNGALHLGHAYSALVNMAFARAMGGRLLLRIEDIDRTRCTPALEAAMRDDLRWLGFEWSGEPRRQSQHFGFYAASLARLEAEGLLYRSYETRSEIKAAGLPQDPDGAPLFSGPLLDVQEIARRAERNERFAWRLHMREAVRRAGLLNWTEFGADGARQEVIAEPLSWGDVILARKETPTSYHLSVVCDDALQGVSHVVRGRDLYAATAVHRLLQALLGFDAPLYHHHRLILDADGHKLSKSRASTALKALRDAGHTPTDIRRMVGLP